MDCSHSLSLSYDIYFLLSIRMLLFELSEVQVNVENVGNLPEVAMLIKI
jgi:hypothetical protein